MITVVTDNRNDFATFSVSEYARYNARKKRRNDSLMYHSCDFGQDVVVTTSINTNTNTVGEGDSHQHKFIETSNEMFQTAVKNKFKTYFRNLYMMLNQDGQDQEGGLLVQNFTDFLSDFTSFHFIDEKEVIQLNLSPGNIYKLCLPDLMADSSQHDALLFNSFYNNFLQNYANVNMKCRQQGKKEKRTYPNISCSIGVDLQISPADTDIVVSTPTSITTEERSWEDLTIQLPNENDASLLKVPDPTSASGSRSSRSSRGGSPDSSKFNFKRAVNKLRHKIKKPKITHEFAPGFYLNKIENSQNILPFNINQDVFNNSSKNELQSMVSGHKVLLLDLIECINEINVSNAEANGQNNAENNSKAKINYPIIILAFVGKQCSFFSDYLKEMQELQQLHKRNLYFILIFTCDNEDQLENNSMLTFISNHNKNNELNNTCMFKHCNFYSELIRTYVIQHKTIKRSLKAGNHQQTLAQCQFIRKYLAKKFKQYSCSNSPTTLQTQFDKINLNMFISDPQFLKIFKKFCFRTYCIENVLFYETIMKFAGEQELEIKFEIANIVYSNYLEENSPFMVNISEDDIDKVRRDLEKVKHLFRESDNESTRQTISDLFYNIFEDCFSHVMLLMSDSFARFVQTPDFEDYLRSTEMKKI